MGSLKGMIKQIDKLVPSSLQLLWNHEAGPKTVFFWAPTIKWGLVLAGLADIMEREGNEISIPQTMALLATGLTWSRYSLVITPVNYNLFTVNVFITLTQLTQIAKAIKNKSAEPSKD